MKKLYWALILGMFLLGGAIAGVSLSADKEVSKGDKEILDRAGLTDFIVTSKDFEDYTEVHCFKEGVVNKKKIVKTKYEICIPLNQSDWYMDGDNFIQEECELIVLTSTEIEEVVKGFEDTCINAVKSRQVIKDSKEAEPTTEERTITITEVKK